MLGSEDKCNVGMFHALPFIMKTCDIHLPKCGTWRPALPPELFTGPAVWQNSGLSCGGVERQLYAMAGVLAGQGHELVLLCESLSAGKAFFMENAVSCVQEIISLEAYQAEPQTVLLSEKVLHQFRALEQLFHDPALSRYVHFFMERRPRLVHCWNADLLAGAFGALLAGVPRIVLRGCSMTPRMRFPFGFESFHDELAKNLLGYLLTFPAVRLGVNSSAGCCDYADWLGLECSDVPLMRNAFLPSQWAEAQEEEVTRLRRNFGIPDGAPVLGGIFRLSLIKDPQLWIETALTVLEDEPEAFAVLCVDDGVIPALRSMLDGSECGKRILLTGFGMDLAAFYRMCSVLLITSHVEGLPNVALEAQYYQRPVVSTLCGGIGDVVDDGRSGLIFAEREAKTLASGVLYVMRHREWARQAGEMGRSRVLRVFSPELAAGDILKLYAV